MEYMGESPAIPEHRDSNIIVYSILYSNVWIISYLNMEYMGESPAIPEHRDSKLSK